MCFSHYCGSKLWPQLQDQIIAFGGWFQSGGYSNEFGVKNPGVSANYSLGNHMQVSCPCLSFSVSQMGHFSLDSIYFKGIHGDNSLPHSQRMWNFLCSNNTIVSFSSQSTIIYLVITLGFGQLSLTAGGSFRGVCRQGFSATCPAAWMLADESRSIFQSIKPESLDAAQENNIAKSYWWLSESQPPRLPYNIRMWNHLKKTVGNSLWCLSINNT